MIYNTIQRAKGLSEFQLSALMGIDHLLHP